MSKKLCIKTYGCQMNEYDSAKIAELMKNELGFEATALPQHADLVILNTCSVREKAQEKLFSELGLLRKLKQQNPNLIIAVGGCVANQEKNQLIKRAPIVDIVFGTQTWQRLPKLYADYLKRRIKIADTDFCAKEKFCCLKSLAENKPISSVAYITIMEGCNKFCSYCIVPYTRGREKSRALGDIVQEVNALAKQGVKEIIFLGQNVNNYRSVKSDGTAATLATLIEETAKNPLIARIRFITSHPSNLDDELISLYAREMKLASHLHLPVQSGSNRILKAMRRNYTHEEYCEKIYKLREARRNISISTDFIVGFPSETDEDFADTMELANIVGFDNSFSFIYSPRPETKASKLVDNIPLTIKKQRLQILQQALNSSAAKISADMMGSMQKVIVGGFSKKDKAQLFGRSENNRVINFTASKELIGQMVKVKIIKALPNSLLGELCL